jgi:hypothetical protein
MFHRIPQADTACRILSVGALDELAFGPDLAQAERQSKRLTGIVMLRLASGDNLNHHRYKECGQA